MKNLNQIIDNTIIYNHISIKDKRKSQLFTTSLGQQASGSRNAEGCPRFMLPCSLWAEVPISAI